VLSGLKTISHAKFLGNQIAGEAARILDQDDADAVILDAVEQGAEAGPRLDRIGTGYCRIVEPSDQFEAGMLGEALDRDPLPLLAVLVGADVGGRRCTQVSDRLNQISLAFDAFNFLVADL
jgi:hypothetical protein